MSYGAQWFLVVGIAVTFVLMAMGTTQSIESARRRRAVKIVAVVVAVLGVFAYWPMPEIPAWEEPGTEQERKARDFAHSIVLPDSIPKPVSFNFAFARLRALIPGQPQVSTQYFKHLCDTEAGQYIFKTVENVDGFLQMRPRRRYTDIELMDPFFVESAIGLHAAEAGQVYKASGGPSGAPMYFVQPMLGNYRFIEQANYKGSSNTTYLYRDAAHPDPTIGPYAIQTANRKTGKPVSVPFMVAEQLVDTPRSSYGYVWRGIRRQNDRIFSIAGGEIIVLDLASKKLLAVYREFKLGQGQYKRWDLSRWCVTGQPDYEHLFIPKVLIPSPTVNDDVPVLQAN